jgi:hypothetical protein
MPVTTDGRSVCANQERLERHCRLAVPPFDAFDLVTNKARLLEYHDCGVRLQTVVMARDCPDVVHVRIGGGQARAVAPSDRNG